MAARHNGEAQNGTAPRGTPPMAAAMQPQAGPFRQVTTTGDAAIKNQSVSEFILVGLASSPEMESLLLGAFAFIYTMALAGNFLLILAICTCKKLHTPMYFLLINLSLVNVLSISVTTTKMLQNLGTHRKSISFYGCFAQVHLFVWALVTETLILAFMAFDRYAAICHPLQYTLIMRKEICVGITVSIWFVGLAHSTFHLGLLLQLPFCSSNIINHFFCDIPLVLKLSCSDTSLNESLTSVAAAVFGICNGGLTLTSYFFIVRTVFRIPSTQGKKKAFSTCSSHLIVASFYFSSGTYNYITPNFGSFSEKDKFISLLYTVVTPVLNPIVYSLRNKDVKEALKSLNGRGLLLQRPQWISKNV
ncbi:olfactory receptor 5AN1-like [Tiliqua scincoides]|uniref:olfactory receptor 5AN1-like n=1 Tax=Tiliqua scincoides TaxID=71010 RepID=UPI00346331E2